MLRKRLLRHFSTFLRDYQEECIQTSIEHFQVHGVKRQAVSLPVGAGKTVIFSNLISRLQSPLPKAEKVLVLAHRVELLNQACTQIKKFNPDKVIELEKGSFRADVGRADIVVASVPTLGRTDEYAENNTTLTNERLERFRAEDFKCIIIDEAHHSAAPSYKKILDHFGVFRDDSHILVWGCSATLRRNDHLALGDLFEKVVYHVDIQAMIQSGWLCQPNIFEIYTEFDLDSVGYEKGSGDFCLSDLSLAVNTPKRNNLIAETWKSEALQKHQRKSTIVFAVNIDHVYGLKKAFEEICAFSPKVITGKTEPYERAQILHDFGEGRERVIINCSVLTEGTDIPRTDCILLARPTCNSSLYIQMLGRGLRKHHEKSDCLILDVVDKMKSPKRSLITFPSLMAPNSEYYSRIENEEEGTMMMRKRKDKKLIDEINFDSVRVKINHINYLNLNLETESLAWVKIPSFPIHVLECSEFRIILMEESSTGAVTNEKNLFSAIVTVKRQEMEDKFNGFERVHSHSYKQTIGSGQSITNILKLVDQYISEYEHETQKQVLPSLSRSAFWRRTFPPTQKQTAILLKESKRFKTTTEEEISVIFKASKGQAAAALTRINFLKTIKAPLMMISWSDIIK